MRRPVRVVPFVLLAALPAAGRPARADVVLLADGARLEGKVTSESAEEVVVQTTFDGERRVPRAQVKSIDRSVPPLREQLAFRLEDAGRDDARLWEVHRWAKEKGFAAELEAILLRIVEVAPEDRRARKLLGHEKVDGRWMSPGEKTAWAEERHAEEMRARGLVLHEGRWVTPEEKAALEKGLLKDGEDWVTEEEFHRRRGEQRVDGTWVRVGEAEAQAFAAEVAAGTGVTLVPLWAPHADVFHDGSPEVARRTQEAVEAMYGALRRALRPAGDDLPETLENRVKIVMFKKQPAYAKFAKWFDEREKTSDLVPGWGRAVAKQHAFWWAHPERVAAVYQFPNTEKTFVSNALHNVGLVWLTRYRLNFKFPSTWLLEGFAYWLEMEALGYSESFTIGRGGTGQTVAPGATEGEPPAWSDSARWKAALTTLVVEGRDPPLKRLAAMSGDQMGYEELVKSWSVVDCLIRKDPARFKAFVDGVKDRSLDEETALRAAFGGGYREVDQMWRSFVQAGFHHP